MPRPAAPRGSRRRVTTWVSPAAARSRGSNPLGVAPEHGELGLARRDVDDELQQESVELRLGQRVGALVLDRVLRRGDEERVGQRPRHAVGRDLALLHRLEQRRLRLGRRAVDLVGQHDVREDRSLAELELAGLRVVHERARDVARHEVGRELDALRVEAERRSRTTAPAGSWRRPARPPAARGRATSSAMSSPVTVPSWPTTALPTSRRTRFIASLSWSGVGRRRGVRSGVGHGAFLSGRTA